ncbi:CDP-glucose 4,6-dehydratase [Sinomicrobium kalidii]|uniref:CDP-glucose 4,6-dehydratase n=1 Tax=Sinomicrobium kalidii TaxID=2900738 RepID=UPI001E41EBC1|nr:CDP-glucose 4,6-dehydratase [Sinomicrobium kalidii]UGU14379.1 CDP-glucose 4,6-dehydratase [Sinomicrobium kalidii]
MEIESLFKNKYKGKKILVTGHTGFKGSWLTLWLKKMGATVHGVALEPNTSPNHIGLLNLEYESHILDITHKEVLTALIEKIKPDLIFHLAAQPLVRLSYEDPYNTYLTNIMGTINVLEAARRIENLKGVVVVTSDKCYENREWLWGYRENEAMGGKDPYSSSKGCAELVTAAYRNSYFPESEFGKSHHTIVASVRAGNVIGGGDWAKDRIIPDMVKSASKNESLLIRYPKATRPWQHVLEPLSGYLNIGQKMLEGDIQYSGAWNFGPNNESNVCVLNLVKAANQYWKDISYEIDQKEHLPEANFLMLDSTKANKLLQWKPIWGFQETVKYTIEWFQEYYLQDNTLSEDHLEKYIADAINEEVTWAIQ